MADESNASDIYRSGEYRVRHPDWHEADAPFKARHIFEMLQRHPFPIATIAEIGCGSGAVLAELSRRLPDVSFFGFDVAPAAIEIARKFESERVHFELRELDQFAGQTFDLAMMIDVFEHVPDYLGFLRQARPLAKRFIFHIPLDLHMQGLWRDAQIDARDGLGHLHYFSEATALRTLEDTGYRVLATQFTAGALQIRSWKRALAAAPRWALFQLSPGLAAKFLGGFSLLVLAEPQREP